jgi:hypothetical protein
VASCVVGGHPAPAGRALTNDLCGQYFKIKVKINAVLAFAEINKLAKIILKLNDYITRAGTFEIDVRKD